jgi:hypothetical protein
MDFHDAGTTVKYLIRDRDRRYCWATPGRDTAKPPRPSTDGNRWRPFNRRSSTILTHYFRHHRL